MDHASSEKMPRFSMQMWISIRSTFGLDCRDRAYTELQVGFNMLQLISVDSGHFTHPELWL